MSDYKTKRRRQPARTVGVRELKTHAADIVRQVREAKESYVVTHRGERVGVLLPVTPETPVGAATNDDQEDAAWAAFLEAGRRLQRHFSVSTSGVAQLSQDRR